MSAADPLRILIVDDDPSALALLERHLTKAGYEVATAEDGVEAMRFLQTTNAPIVITDWVMPKMDGLELCRAIRAHEGIPFAYVIVVTGQETADGRLVDAFDAGADDYLCKPYKAKELLARIGAGERLIRLQKELDTRNREVHRYNAEVEIANSKLEAANEELNRMATTDDLTGLFNRREALSRLSDAWVSTERHGNPLACVTLDIDRFKNCNDAYGHDAGDVVLKETAKALLAAARRDEPVCRVGGEEFLIICSGSSEALAAIGAERLRRAVEDTVIHCGDLTLGVTISLGVAQRTPKMKSPDELLQAADNAMYRAKDAGRNCVCLAGEVEEEPSAGDPHREVGAAFLEAMSGNDGSDEPTKVLVVDDDASMRDMCREFLEREGHKVSQAVDGEDALRTIEHELPDVIIMDAVMPHIDGAECTRKLKTRSETRGIPVIFTVARTDASNMAAGLEAGADEYLAKPLNPEELVLRVQSMIRLGREWGRSNELRGEQSRSRGVLSDFCRHIAGAESFDDALERTLSVAAGLMCCRRVSIMLPDADSQTLTVAKSLGIEPHRWAGIRVKIGGMTSGRVFESREPLMIETAGEARQRGGDPDALLLSSLPSLSIPLCAPDCVVGVLNLTGRQDGRPFATVELEYLDLVCDIAGLAIHERFASRARDEAGHSIVVALAKLAEHRDSETGGHIDRVTRFCHLLARQLRSVERYQSVITDEFLADLQRAVPLHDIGKVAIPDRILQKPGALNKAEVALMQTHTTIGANTIRHVRDGVSRQSQPGFLAPAQEIAQGHHEWYDGSGYPCNVVGDDIPFVARIAALADVYDAITTKRVYKDAKSHHEALTIITDASGTQFDPDMVNAFHRCEEEFERVAMELADDVATLRQTVASAPCGGGA